MGPEEKQRRKESEVCDLFVLPDTYATCQCLLGEKKEFQTVLRVLCQNNEVEKLNGP